ncbi:MAG TPA: non-heme iron oxygenase ferredoxin subunit [Burkholderiaceae bacterium]|jgi:3-phenylpropionate/trans-cinnamate dioxygenase ferredoxin subunit|nr:non-heme iron oxygenase ferredoxin subunit [Burkholderiaceae bacterium]
MSDWIDVELQQTFAPGTRRAIDVNGTQVAVFNLDGTYYAIEDVCPHDGGALAEGRLDDEQIICPRHGARFSIITGKVLAPPAYEDITSFPVRVDGGMVQVRDPRWD